MSDPTPFVSVILPIRNEAGTIERCLGALLDQDYPPERLEVLVADGRSSDDTRARIEALLARYPGRAVSVLDNERQIFSTGFNLGLQCARGEVIVMMGGHAVPARDYVRRAVAYLARGDADCVGGYIDTVGETAIAKAIALAMSSWFGVGGVGFRTRPDTLAPVDTVAFGAYRADVFRRFGPIDEEMVRNQDDELNYRLRKHGARILLVPDMQLTYYSRARLAALWSQYHQYGYWKVRVMQKHPRQMRVRHFVPAAFVAALGAGALGAVLPLPGPLPLAALAGAYVAGAGAACVQGVLRARAPWALLTLPVFPLLHLSYGSGFLRGLLAFGVRPRI